MHTDEVVRVHDCVDESIQKNGEINISIIVDIGIEPIKQENGGVMVHMQEGELTPFLSQNDKDCVPKVPYFGDVEEPKQISHGGIVDVEGIAGSYEGVSVAVGEHSRLDGHVGTEEDLGDVV